MNEKSDLEKRICSNCNVALLYPMEKQEFQNIGWHQCEFCAYCIIIEELSYKNRTKYQK